jgi:hypothetical protein
VPCRLKELHNGLIFEGRGIGKIYHDVRIGQRLCETFPRNSVDTRVRRSRCYLMPQLTKFGDHLRTYEACASNDYDFHNLKFLFSTYKDQGNAKNTND